MTQKGLENLHSLDIHYLGQALEHLTNEELTTYWAYVASFPERDDERNTQCQAEYKARLITGKITKC